MTVDFPSHIRAFALSWFRATKSRRALILALALIVGAGVGWPLLRHRAAERAIDMAAMDPSERALREAALKAPQNIEARRAVGQYLVAQRRPYEAMWAYQDALELRPGDEEARRGLARALIMAQLPRRGLEVLAERPAASSPIHNPKSKIQNDVE